jgi:DNA-binding transcriptional ArsR family regulator
MVAQEMARVGRCRRKDCKRQAAVFAALGDETRLVLLARLCEVQQASITQLASGLPVTRQAITKHLRVLESAGTVRGIPSGRETLFELHPRPLVKATDFLQAICREWDEALEKLKAFVQRTST